MNARLLPAENDALGDTGTTTRLGGRGLRALLRLLGIVLYHLGLARAIIGLSPWRIRTLLYHAVEDHPGSHTAGLDVSVSPATFNRHLDYIGSHYQVISMEDLLRGRVPPRSAILTFDDGYRSVAENAAPALDQRGLPATVYVIGKTVMGGMVWVNRLNHALHRYPQLTMSLLAGFPGLADLQPRQIIHRVQTRYPPMMIDYLMAQLDRTLPADDSGESLFLTPEQIRLLQRRGISFGFHSNDHFNLRLCNEETLRQQLDSREIDHLLDSRTFACPFGYCGDREADRLEARGFQRTLLVQQDTPHPRRSHLKRSEPRAGSAASLFAQLEVEEPVMSWLRTALRLRDPID